MDTKENKINWKFIAIAAAVVLAVGVLFVWANYFNNRVQSPMDGVYGGIIEDNSQVQQTVPETATTTSDDTADWQTYRNEKCGFEIKYPSVYHLYGGGEAGVIFASSDYINCKNSGKTLTCEEVGSNSPSVECLSAASTLQGETIETYLARKTRKNFPVKKIIVGGISGFEIEDLDMVGSYRQICFLSGDNLVNFYIAKEGNGRGQAFFEQMLSTFKFIDDNQPAK